MNYKKSFVVKYDNDKKSYRDCYTFVCAECGKQVEVCFTSQSTWKYKLPHKISNMFGPTNNYSDGTCGIYFCSYTCMRTVQRQADEYIENKLDAMAEARTKRAREYQAKYIAKKRAREAKEGKNG